MKNILNSNELNNSLMNEKIKILVTGANGFVGRAVVDALRSNGVEVYCISHLERLPEDDHTIICDMDNYNDLPNFFSNASPDVFYHLLK